MPHRYMSGRIIINAINVSVKRGQGSCIDKVMQPNPRSGGQPCSANFAVFASPNGTIPLRTQNREICATSIASEIRYATHKAFPQVFHGLNVIRIDTIPRT